MSEHKPKNHADIIVNNLKELLSDKELVHMVESELAKTGSYKGTKREHVRPAETGTADAVLNEDGERLARLLRLLAGQKKYDEIHRVTMDAAFREQCFQIYKL